MATLDSDLATTSTTMAHERVSGKNVGGDLLIMAASVTTTAAAAASTINVGTLPVGAVVIPALSHVVHGAVGTSVTFDVGDSVDPNRYADDLDVAAAGTTQFDISLTTEFPVTEATNDIIITTAGATMDADIEVLVLIAYRVAR